MHACVYMCTQHQGSSLVTDICFTETTVGYSSLPPLAVFIAMATVIITRLRTEIKSAREAQIEAINNQIAGLTGPIHLNE